MKRVLCCLGILSLLFCVAVACFWPISFKVSSFFRVHDNNVPGEETPPIFLGSSGTDIEKARAHIREMFAQRLKWETNTTLGEYNRIGKKDPRWDNMARDVLTQTAHVLAAASDIQAGVEATRIPYQRVLEAGCDDPLVLYNALRVECYPADINPLELAKRYTDVAQLLEKSDISPIRKCLAATRAAQKLSKAWQGDGLVPVEVKANIAGYLSCSRTHFLEVLSDPAAERNSVYSLAVVLFNDAARECPGGRAQVFEPFAALFSAGNRKSGGDEARESTVEGIFWTHYAWDARSSGWANEVAEDGERLFQERLQKAADALEKAWAKDPADPEAALEMISVEMGQGQGRERLEKWFRRAMDADPDSSMACARKMLYLTPRWHGNLEDVLEFGKQCLATADWGSVVPFTLLGGLDLVAETESSPEEFWRDPAIWRELENLFSVSEAACPDSTCLKSSHALYAFRAGKWAIANELFTALGDRVDLASMQCTQEQYESMRSEAAEKSR